MEPTPGWVIHPRRPSRPTVATTALQPPGGAVVANLRGPLTALRVREALSRGPDLAGGPASWSGLGALEQTSGRGAHVPRPPRRSTGAPAPLPEEDLVERARTDPDAFAELYRRYVTRVHAFVYRRSRSTELADEITSSTFERALRALPELPLAGRRVPGLALPHRRQRAGQPLPAGAAPAERAGPAGRRASSTRTRTPPASRLGERRRATSVLQALGRLNERYQRAITLRYLAGSVARGRRPRHGPQQGHPRRRAPPGPRRAAQGHERPAADSERPRP